MELVHNSFGNAPGPMSVEVPIWQLSRQLGVVEKLLTCLC